MHGYNPGTLEMKPEEAQAQDEPCLYSEAFTQKTRNDSKTCTTATTQITLQVGLDCNCSPRTWEAQVQDLGGNRFS